MLTKRVGEVGIWPGDVCIQSCSSDFLHVLCCHSSLVRLLQIS